jgi:signal recognition particle subunit SRP72
MSSKKKGSNRGGDAAKKEPQDTSAMYADLMKLQNNREYEKAMKTCNKILNVAPVDTTAFHCKIVCLIQMAKFDNALQQMGDNENLAPEEGLVFEKAYAYYRLNRPKDALDALGGMTSKSLDPRCKELKAQVLYKMEKYEECFTVYRDIIKNTGADEDFETERLTNLLAASVLIESGSGKGAFDVPIDDDQETYEILYNSACKLLAEERWEEAEKALIRAEKMCLEQLQEDEDEDEEDIERETGVIRVQIGFAVQMQGKEKEAQAIYNGVLKNKPTDIGVIAAASNNIISLNKDQNIFDSKKRIKAATAEGLEHKLPASHRMAIARNNALLAMYTNQVDVCRSLVQELADTFGVESNDRDMITAGVLSRAGKTKEAVKVLLGGADNKNDLEKILIATQIYLEKGEVDSALKLLDGLPKEEKYLSGILSAMVTLYLAKGDRHAVAALLKDAVAFSKSSNRKDGMSIVWRKAAEFHLKGNEPAVAAQSLEELIKIDPEDRQTLAQLVLAYAKFDLKKALAASKKLPKFSYGSVDVEALESSTFLGAKHASRTAGQAKTPGGIASPKISKDDLGEDEKTKIKKKRKNRHMPKNFNPDVDPDPERWLPRRERTGYRKPRKDRRKGEKFTGAQGTAAGQSETYDYSSKKSAAAGGAVPKSPAARQESSGGPRQQQRKPQAKKKGGKKRF